MKISNISNKNLICQNASLADTPLSRIVGLLKRESLSSDEGMVITHCRSIHMFFMRFAIDVIFIDKNSRIVGLVKSIKPFRMSPYFFKACSAIELAAGTIEKTKTLIGDQILFEE